MGSCSSKAGDDKTLDIFKAIKCIGQGSFGLVFLGTINGNPQKVALKCLSKNKIVNKQTSAKSLWEERNAMVELNKTGSPFLMPLLYAFQDTHTLYLVMPFSLGGDMCFHLKTHGSFSPDDCIFYLGQIVHGLETLHAHDYVYRDLKPENLLLDEIGYLKITDFGLIEKLCEDDGYLTNGVTGTDGYIAPEVLDHGDYGREVDFYSLGCVFFEMLHAEMPFGQDENKCRDMDLLPPIDQTLPEDCKALVLELMCKDREKRIGRKGGWKQVKNHPYFTNRKFDWAALVKKELVAPRVPDSNEEKWNCDDWLDEAAEQYMSGHKHSLLFRSEHKVFENFEFVTTKKWTLADLHWQHDQKVAAIRSAMDTDTPVEDISIGLSEGPEPDGAKNVLDALTLVLEAVCGEASARIDESNLLRPTYMPNSVRIDESNLVRLTYMSKETRSMPASAMKKLSRAAQAFNGSAGITGFLVHLAPWFFQTLEGPRETLEVLAEKITADSRHTDIRLLEDKDVRTRKYPMWSMEMVDINQKNPPEHSWSALQQLAIAADACSHVAPGPCVPVERDEDQERMAHEALLQASKMQYETPMRFGPKQWRPCITSASSTRSNSHSANSVIVAASQVPRPHNAKSVLDCLLLVLKEGAGELPAAVETDEDLVRVTYMSKETHSMSASDVRAIHRVAQAFNGSAGITGFLVHQAPWFFQTLEGPGENVDRLLAKISADPRHRNVRVLEKEQFVRTRLYPRWTMEVVDVGTGAKPSKSVRKLVKQATIAMAPEALKPTHRFQKESANSATMEVSDVGTQGKPSKRVHHLVPADRAETLQYIEM